MRFAGIYFVGFALLAAGVLLAMWKIGVLAMIGTFWTVVALVTLLGVGIMVAVMNGGNRTIEIDR